VLSPAGRQVGTLPYSAEIDIIKSRNRRDIRYTETLGDILKSLLTQFRNMKRKKILLSIGLIFIFLLIMAFSPWKMGYSKFNNDCESYCEDLKNSSGLERVEYGLECQLPLDGCFQSCMGIRIGEKCSEKSKCFDSCETTCFGVGFSSCRLNVFERKINFLTSKDSE